MFQHKREHWRSGLGNREVITSVFYVNIDFEIPEEHSCGCATWAFGNVSLLLRERTKVDAIET